ncbi:MAG: energy-coupling factor ABC transporter permease [Candidatus Thorarchaeota archaeon]|nr:energy-coupling factor ABC transporter permease [Candidatus Thorarchaeota archaeon]
MHVPDGVFPLWLQILMWIVSGSMIVISVRQLNKKFDERTVPYLGVLAAVIFAAQYVNFPVPPSSGHLVGTTLIAVMLGPWAGILVIALVLFVQALYGDGGMLTYGINLFNMGVFSSFFGWFLAIVLFKALKKKMSEKNAVLIGASVASYITVVVAAMILGLELQTVPGFGVAGLVAITGIHALIGIGEAILTFVILLYFVKAHPQVISFLTGSEVSEMASVTEAPWAKPAE